MGEGNACVFRVFRVRLFGFIFRPVLHVETWRGGPGRLSAGRSWLIEKDFFAVRVDDDVSCCRR